jgi:PhzF family phenazine biosynthesis protein
MLTASPFAPGSRHHVRLSRLMTIMRKRRFMQVDVFSDRSGFGNPLAVVVDAEGLDSGQMQRFANWTNLSESSFLLPPVRADADYRVRIFTPRQELPFAGHPSVGAAWVAVKSGLVRPRDGHLVQECAAGLLDVRVEQAMDRMRTHVRAPDANILAVPQELHELIATIFAKVDDFDPRATCMINNGPEWLIAELADEACVRRLVPALPLIEKLCLATHAVGLAVFAESDGPEHQLVVRAFCPADGIPEDPVTGSANAAIGALLLSQGRDRTIGASYRASQGREVGRDGSIEVAMDTSGSIWIGGDTTAVIEGSVDWL